MSREVHMDCAIMILRVIGTALLDYSQPLLKLRYRKHCSNRTHRLRSTLKIAHGKGKDFKKLPPINPEVARDGQ